MLLKDKILVVVELVPTSSKSNIVTENVSNSLVAKFVEARRLRLFQCLDQSPSVTSGNGYFAPQR